MKYLKLITLISLASISALAQPPPVPESPYKAGAISLTPFASYRVHEFGKFDGKWGGGLALEAQPHKNLGVELSTLSEGYRHGEAAVNSLDEASANLKFYVPIKNSGFAPYALLGYTCDLNGGDDDWRTVSKPQTECSDPLVTVHSRDRGDHRMNAGLGLEYRYGFGKLFADAIWTHDFDTIGQAVGRVGAGFNFR